MGNISFHLEVEHPIRTANSRFWLMGHESLESTDVVGLSYAQIARKLFSICGREFDSLHNAAQVQLHLERVVGIEETVYETTLGELRASSPALPW